ncbi:MAG: LLM class flavin-dependent oxidoreductase [Haloferacaceae archaeon]
MPTHGYLLPTRGSVLASDDDETLAARTRADVVGLAERAEALGFDAVWAGDSVLARPRHDPLATLAAVGAATEAVDLGTAVYLPALRKPTTVAHLAASVDQLSGGRLTLGVGAATDNDAVRAEHANAGVAFDGRGARLNELLEIVEGLWGDEPFDLDGDHYGVEDASLGFGPVDDVPVYVPTNSYHPEKGLPRTVRERVIAHADGCLPIAVTPDRYAEALDHVRGLLADAGRDPAAFDAAYYLDVVVADDEATALAEAREFYDRYYDDREPFADEYIRKRGAFGPPAAVAERLDAYAAAGAERLVVRFVTRNQRRCLRRLADLL